MTKGDEIMQLANSLQNAISEKWDDVALEKINSQGAEIIALAEGIDIKTDADYQQANDLLIRVKQYYKSGDIYCTPFKKAAYGPYATVLDILKKIKESTEKATNLINNKTRKWRDIQRKKQEEEQRKADEERRKREEAEKKKLERKADKELEKGNEEKAEELLDAAESAYVPPTVVEKTVQKTETTDAGRVTYVKDWDITVTSVEDVVKAVAAGHLPSSIIKVDPGAVKKWARGMDIKRYKQNGLDVAMTERPQTRWNKG